MRTSLVTGGEPEDADASYGSPCSNSARCSREKEQEANEIEKSGGGGPDTTTVFYEYEFDLTAL
jgi:hypothetical protein